jgi:hypothetical protein
MKNHDHARRGWWLASLACALLGLAGCAGSSAAPGASAQAAPEVAAGAPPEAPPAQPGMPRPVFDVSGVWDGKSVASCLSYNPFAFNTRCNAINKITITMVMETAKITGFYKCSVGNMDCRDQNDSGTIANGKMEHGHLALRIAMPDGSSCIFNGTPTAANRISGSYACYQGGGLAEQGSFEIARNY